MRVDDDTLRVQATLPPTPFVANLSDYASNWLAPETSLRLRGRVLRDRWRRKLLTAKPSLKAHPHRIPVRIGESPNQTDLALG